MVKPGTPPDFVLRVCFACIIYSVIWDSIPLCSLQNPATSTAELTLATPDKPRKQYIILLRWALTVQTTASLIRGWQSEGHADRTDDPERSTEGNKITVLGIAV